MSNLSWRMFCFFGLLLAVLSLPACGGDDDDNDNVPGDSDTDLIAEQESEEESAPTGKVEKRGKWTIVWLEGTPYEMGFQHGTLLHEELKKGLEFIQADPGLASMPEIAKNLGVLDLAYEKSYQDVLDECQGMVDAAGDVGWTMDMCLVLNFGDVLVEFLYSGVPEEEAKRLAKKIQPGCSQAVATGAATEDGRMYHARLLDWTQMDYILEFPTIFVRQPSDGLAHAFIGFPANLSPYSGINEAGISAASNEADPLDKTVGSLDGRSHVQLQAQILKHADSLEKARQMIAEVSHMSAEIITVADGTNNQAAIFEMTGKAVGIRELDDDIVFVTNHFLAQETSELDAEPNGESSANRLARLQQLLPKDATDSLYGTLSPEMFITMMRDRQDPNTGEVYGLDVFDNNSSLATNGALFAIVFDPAKRIFWAAAGEIPVPQQTFQGFSLDELLGKEGAELPSPESFE